MRASIFIAISLDGFIARKDGSIDWLTGAEGIDGEDYGYREFMDTVDLLVMGRNTFDTVAAFDAWPYGDTRVMVLTHRPLARPAAAIADVLATSETPEMLYTRLHAEGVGRIYVDGGLTIQQFLAAGLIDDMTITVLPVLLGEGIPLFGPLPGDVRLRLLSSQAYPNGFVQGRWEAHGSRTTRNSSMPNAR